MAQDVESIGRRLSLYRKEEGWSAQRLADESGLTRSVITNIENGRRSDMTVDELLAVSAALRIPPAALLFPIEHPLSAHEIHEPEGQPGAHPRVIESVDWLSGSDADYGDDDELAEFMRELEALDAVVLYPIGATVFATYGKAGRKARALIRGGRLLARLQDRADRLARDIRIFGKLSPDADTEEFNELLNQGALMGSPPADAFLDGLDEDDRPIASRLMRAHQAAESNLRDAQASFRLLGGDPRPSGVFMGAVSPRWVMNVVQGGPHESLAELEARGHIAEGVVSSPLRVYWEDQVERIRSEWGAHGNGLDQAAP
ncbi:helix-turn-helix transcriptional regulator [Microbacterium sp. KSW-18]|uniref:Helix-turn-helix transcriptional regulator n=1 Tax=Microbacterium aquilitoris TaxID=3067307 RepID=A0ABU3GKY7_9MICO|nr:helix-turn-helix transcriptional regulator [Microbacterium sp. KSW-18]MDT3331376.1 helix-turn-helix transcriptional regulator [Microbacterium sp. KSW-18]